VLVGLLFSSSRGAYVSYHSHRIDDPAGHVQQYPDFDKIAARQPDETLPIPSPLPAVTPHSTQYRFAETSIYPSLETNIDAFAMSFSQEPFPENRTALNIQRHGVDSPFRHWKDVQGYIQDLLSRRGYQDLVTYNTTVELVQKNPVTGTWTVTLRQPLPEGREDQWWSETFDAVIVAAGHYTVPFIPHTPGLAAFAHAFPGSVEHSKAWRDPEKYRDKRTVVVGASISGPDIASSLADVAETPLHCVVRGKYHPYFFDYAFQHPKIRRQPPITHVTSSRATGERTVHFEDGTSVEDVDHLIFGTGYTWTLPFLPDLAATIRQNRVPNLYQHIFWREDPTLCFVGAIAAGFTFKVFEWQAVLAARFLAGRIALPPQSEQRRWEEERIASKGDGVPFTALYPDFEAYFEEVRLMAGEPLVQGRGRRLPPFEKAWRDGFDRGHLLRIEMWKRENHEARRRMEEEPEGKTYSTSRTVLYRSGDASS
jgi:hypothetical protein